VPGNIFQYVGRQAIGTSTGIGSAVLMKSTLWEIGCIVSTSAIFGGLHWLIALEVVPLGVATIIFSITIFAVIAVVGRWLGPPMGRAVAFHATYLAVVGAVFASFLASQLFVHSGWNWSILLVCFSAYVVAWLVGLLTPGAPAGLGVRETALYGLLHHIVGNGELLTAILLSRIANVVGDALLYSWAIWQRPPSSLTQGPV
jgi:hypothetical protein